MEHEIAVLIWAFLLIFFLFVVMSPNPKRRGCPPKKRGRGSKGGTTAISRKYKKSKLAAELNKQQWNEEKAEIDDHDEIDVVPDLEENLKECLDPDAFTNSI